MQPEAGIAREPCGGVPEVPHVAVLDEPIRRAKLFARKADCLQERRLPDPDLGSRVEDEERAPDPCGCELRQRSLFSEQPIPDLCAR